jgi:hypothetical protein
MRALRYLAQFASFPGEWCPVFLRSARSLAFRRGTISRLVTKGPSGVFRTQISQSLIGRHPSPRFRRWMGKAVDILTSWHAAELTHSAATSLLGTLLSERPPRGLRWDDYLELSRQAMRVGLYHASLEFQEAGWSSLNDAMGTKNDTVSSIFQLRALIYRGRLEEASNRAQSLARRRLVPTVRGELDELRSYLVHCGYGQESTTPHEGEGSFERKWLARISGSNVLVYGPGATENLPSPTPLFLVARVMGPSVYTWNSDDDLVGNKTDIVYSNPENLSQGFDSGSEDFRRVVSAFPFMCVKRGGRFLPPNARSLKGFGSLFQSGHPNMVPLIVLDVLASSGIPHVIGSDFFTSAVAYRESDRRTVGWGSSAVPDAKQSAQGSAGGDFDRSSLMSSHNSIENWALMRNLHRAGSVSGDQSFEDVMEYDLSQLVDIYDRVIGSLRI